MKKIIPILAIFSVGFSCGEAGFGFDAAVEEDFSRTIEISTPDNIEGSVTIDPPTEVIQYDLAEVDGFESAVDALNDVGGKVFFRDLGIQVDGVEADERLPLEAVDITINLNSGPINFRLFSNQLNNVDKFSLKESGQLTLENRREIANQLLDTQELESTVVIDFAPITELDEGKDIDFVFTLFFDVAIRVEDILD